MKYLSIILKKEESNFVLITLVLLLILSNPSKIKAQESEEQEFGISFSGFVKNDFYYDTRQTHGAREEHLLFFPKNIEPDEDGEDINAQGSFQFLSIQSRLSGNITAPDAFGAKASGLLEAEFFGNTNLGINEFRLRHAIINLDWGKTKLLMGQFWHPMVITDCLPGTISFNTGIVFQPFARNPQIRLSHTIGNLRVTGIVFTERDFGSWGINNTPSNSYLRNSQTPQVNLQFQHSLKPEKYNFEIISGAGAGYKSILPQNTTSANYKTNEMVKSFSALGFIAIKTKPITVKIEAVYAENMTDAFYFGGFAVLDTIDTKRKEVTYTPLRSAAAWIDISTNGKTWQTGIFAGYNQALGASQDIQVGAGGPFGFFPDIESVFRVSPRISWNSGRARIAAEVEYTVANYGDGTFSSRGLPNNPNEVYNIRYLIGTYLFF